MIMVPEGTELPDLFTNSKGERVENVNDWAQRRKEIIATLLDIEYGHLPPVSNNLKSEEISSTPLESGLGIEKRIRLTCGPDDAIAIDVLLTLPNGDPKPGPVILTGDLCWKRVPITDELLEHGYRIAEFDRTEIAKDAPGRNDPIHTAFPDGDFAALSAWAWGYHRVVDYLLTRADVDKERIAITGHSRGGKGTLLAGALDERIALTAPNQSGCGGAGSYRRQGDNSESLKIILQNFPYWFHPNLAEYIGRENKLPFDQHELLALVAPRMLLITNALGDTWANPSGTQRTYVAAKRVFEFLGAGARIGNYYREGKHEQNPDDWRTLLEFMDMQFFGKPSERDFHGREF